MDDSKESARVHLRISRRVLVPLSSLDSHLPRLNRKELFSTVPEKLWLSLWPEISRVSVPAAATLARGWNYIDLADRCSSCLGPHGGLRVKPWQVLTKSMSSHGFHPSYPLPVQQCPGMELLPLPAS